MKKILCLIPLGVSSVLFGLSFETAVGPQWEHFEGWISHKGNKIDIKKDLGLSDTIHYSGYIELRHDISLLLLPIPDFKIEFIKISTSGTSLLSREIQIGGKIFNVGEKITSSVKFDQYDFTFFYTPLKLILFKLRTGLGVKLIDFSYDVKSLTTSQKVSKEATLPLPFLYLKGDFKFQFLRLYSEFKALPLGSSYFYDSKTGAGLYFK